tara:strand:- start:472 stop:678 length:207 start_codon:yes stop_codon:yes gene_type:complete
MKIYKFAKYIWCWDIISGEEPYAYIKANTEEEAIKTLRTKYNRGYDSRTSEITVVPFVPNDDLSLLLP